MHGGAPFVAESGIEREGWILLKIPRGDINGVGEDEVTVTSGLHAQPERTNKPTEESGLPYIVTSGLHAPAERTNRQTEERGLHPVEASTKIRSQMMLLTHGAHLIMFTTMMLG